MVLYQDWFCLQSHRVRRSLRRFRLRAEVSDVRLHPELRDELRRITGQDQVPCLIVDDEAICGGPAILRYLQLRYGGQGENPSREGGTAQK